MPSEVPAGWRKQPLKKLGKFVKSKGGPKKDESHEGVPVVRYGELYTKHDDVIRGFHSFVPPEVAEKKYTRLRVGDVLFAGSGETLAEIGKSAAFLGPEPAYGSGDIIIFRPGRDLDPLFVGYASNGPDAVRHKSRTGQGSSVMHIYTHNLEKLPLLVPPLPEQKKIAAILSSVDEAIQATQAVIEQTRRVKEGLLQDLLTRGIGHTRFKQTEIGEIPEAWEVRPLQTLGLVDCGKAKNKSQNDPLRPYLRVANVLDDEISPVDVLTMPFSDEEFAKYRLEPGDILLNEGQSLDLVGRPAVYRGTPPNVAMQNALLRWRPDPGMVDPEFGYQSIRRLYLTGVFSLVATQTTSIAHLGLGRFRQLLIAVPPLEEQREIAAILNAADAPRRNNEADLDQLQQVKAGLLQDLLTGKVRVSV